MKTYEITDAQELLRDHFGYTSFHSGQEEIIERILNGQDILAIMPTGAGKSLCYQIPALMFSGVTIVVSPLISLMKDQVDDLRRMGIPAKLLNSSISPQEASETYRALQDNEVKILYIAPERLEAEGFTTFLSGLEISMVAVDEAHCVSQWGHDFRPSYRRIREMIVAFPHRPRVGAFTATATERVTKDILSLLDLRSPYVLCTGFDRPNLHFAVYAPADRDKYIIDYLRANADASGIVYCLTRKQVDKLSDLLVHLGLSALPYHAGLPDDVRRKNQDAFRNDSVNVIVATNAFGMGIDKSNVRFVLHCGMPKTLENYYQEAGRAGRDGEKSDCVLLYNSQDIVTNRFLIDAGNDAKDKSDEYKKLRDMIDYCNVDACLRRYILRYFGMTELPESCGNCSNCNDTAEKTDITVEAQKIISCVKRMGNRFGALLTAQVLRGADTEKIRKLGFNNLSTYGIMRDYPEKSIKEIISYLAAHSYLEVKDGEYPTLIAGEKAMRFLKGKDLLYMKRTVETRERRTATPLHEHGELFEKLRVLRKSLADELNVPPYIIFSDASLAGMCSILPRDREEMLLVPGVGKYKLSQYGDEFIFTIKEYMDEHGIEAPAREAPLTKPSRKSARTPSANGDTVMTTFKLYEQGKSIENIADERGLAQTTIESHLMKAYNTGLTVDPDDFIPDEHRKAIFAAIEEHGAMFLKPLKDALPEDVTYTAIRFAVEIYHNQSKNEPPSGL